MDALSVAVVANNIVLQIIHPDGASFFSGVASYPSKVATSSEHHQDIRQIPTSLTSE